MSMTVKQSLVHGTTRCHGYSEKENQMGSRAPSWQVNTTRNSQWHTHKHTLLKPRSVCASRKEPRHTKSFVRKTHPYIPYTLTHIMDPPNWTSWWPPSPLVSQWTLLQPSWRTTQSDMSPATNMGTRWRRGGHPPHDTTSTNHSHV